MIKEGISILAGSLFTYWAAPKTVDAFSGENTSGASVKTSGLKNLSLGNSMDAGIGVSALIGAGILYIGYEMTKCVYEVVENTIDEY